jgi:hypothetical protein
LIIRAIGAKYILNADVGRLTNLRGVQTEIVTGVPGIKVALDDTAVALLATVWFKARERMRRSMPFKRYNN